MILLKTKSKILIVIFLHACVCGMQHICMSVAYMCTCVHMEAWKYAYGDLLPTLSMSQFELAGVICSS